MGHKQGQTRLKTDNATANSFVHASMRTKRSKAWDMRYNWLRQEDINKIIKIFWDKGSNNDAEYFTKHHSLAHHRQTRPRYIQKGYMITNEMGFGRGCVHIPDKYDIPKP